MTLRSQTASAAVADALTRSAPPGKSKPAPAFSSIVLTDDAATKAPDQDFADLLPRLSKAIENGKQPDFIHKLLKASDVRIIVDGSHKVGSGTYVVGGTAQVDADGDGVILAVGDAKVTVRGSFDLYATDRVKLNAFGRTQVYSTGNAKVEGSFDYVRGFAHANVVGKVRGNSVWSLFGATVFDAWDNVSIEADNQSTVRLYDRARAEATGSADIEMRDNATGWFKGGATGQAWGSSIAYGSPEKVKIMGGSARLYGLPSSDSLFSRRDWRAR